MKRTIYLAIAALAFTACMGDNYEEPNVTLYGTVYDAETGEPVGQDINSTQGSLIELIEQGYENPVTRYLNFKSDGSYCEKNLFAGTYDFSVTRSNFSPVHETVELKKGRTKCDLKVLPYLRIYDDTIEYDEESQIVTATFSVERTVDEYTLKTIRLFCDVNKNVSMGMNTSGDNACKKEIGTKNDGSEVYTLRMSTEFLDAGSYYFRIGALVGGVDEAKYNYAPAVRLAIVKAQQEEPEPENPDGPGVCYDDCDSADGWNSGCGSVESDSEDKSQGESCVSVTTKSGSNDVIFSKKRSTGFDPEIPREGAHLRFDFFVEDYFCLPFTEEGTIELGSGGESGTDCLVWDNTIFLKYPISDGWNTVDLKLNWAEETGSFDISAINWFALRHKGISDAITLKLDNIRIYNQPQWHSCDFIGEESSYIWTSLLPSITLDNVNKREGTSSVVATGKGEVIEFLRLEYDEFQDPYAAPCTVENGHFTFWLYLSDASQFKRGVDGEFEISSSRTCDNEEIHWRFMDMNTDLLNDGWNKMDLKLSEGETSGKSINLNGLNWFRMYSRGINDNIEVRIDDMRFYEE